MTTRAAPPGAQASAAGPPPAGAGASPIVPVALAGRGVAHELRAVRIVLYRDLVRFWRDRARFVASFVQPLLFLLVLGGGLAATVGRGADGVDYRTFLFPGVLTTGIMFSAVFSAVSIVWDREFGFLREMLVAPVSRSSIVVGKCLGGACVATAQGLVLLTLAGLVGVPYDPVMLIGVVGMIFLIAFSMTAFGLVLAVRVRTVQTVMPMMQLLLMPLMFLSGSLFPLSGGLPAWLSLVTRINPLSYGVDATRTLVFHHVPAAAGSRLAGGITWWGWAVPAWLEVVLVAVTGVALLGTACILFTRDE